MLRRKMIRDIRQNLSQFITILLMVFIGIMAYSGIESYMEGMKETANNFYGDYNLQDLNVMGELSEENINTIKEISNVKNAEGKLKVNGVLENDDDTTISMNFIEENEISKFYIVDGENFNKDTKGIWLDNFFAEENNLKILVSAIVVAVISYFANRYLSVFNYSYFERIIIILLFDAFIYVGLLLILNENLVCSFIRRKKEAELTK